MREVAISALFRYSQVGRGSQQWRGYPQTPIHPRMSLISLKQRDASPGSRRLSRASAEPTGPACPPKARHRPALPPDICFLGNQGHTLNHSFRELFTGVSSNYNQSSVITNSVPYDGQLQLSIFMANRLHMDSVVKNCLNTLYKHTLIKKKG